MIFLFLIISLMACRETTFADKQDLKTPIETLESIGAGGLSGWPVQEKNTTLLQYIYQQTNGSIPIIGSGGIFNGYDAKEQD